MSKPKLIGVTGGIGSGKSTVCKIFKTLGVPVYNADSRARWLMNNDSVIVDSVTQTFGEESYQNGELNRAFLASTVFNNETKRQELNGIVHPRVALDFEQWISSHADKPYVVKEAALLIESGSYKTLDELVLITAPKAVRIERVAKRDSFRSASEIEAIIDKQMSEEEMRKYATCVIDNGGETLVIPEVIRLNERWLLSTKD